MATTIHVRHQCDRCHATVEDRIAGLEQYNATLMAGWHLFTVAGQPHLWCPVCMEGLQRFRAANESVEQSR